MSEITKKSGIILIICLILQSSALFAEFAGGTGEPDNPYQIATAEQLVSIGSDSSLIDKHFVLVNDIDLDPNLPGGQVFDGPVISQSSQARFEGVFYGNGHNILNLTIDSNTTSGLIGEIGSNGQVRNLGLIGVSISGFNAGSLAVINRGLIRDCYAAGTVRGNYHAGGLVVENRGSVKGSYSICDVMGYWKVGGLLGYSSMESEISYCHATGSVTGERQVGGLVGDASGTLVSQCYTTGSTSGNRNVGGLIGHSTFQCMIKYCYATGSVDGDKNVGGLVGSLLSASIVLCYANGSVSGSQEVGGLIGFCFEEAYLCYFLKAEDGGGPDNGYGTALTSSEITQAANFVGWYFYGGSPDGLEDHWFMPPNSPPVLVWQTDITGLVAVPTLTGLTFNEAETVLTNAGFIVGKVEYDYDRAVPADHVVWSKPAGYAITGTIVNISLSSGTYNWADNPGHGNSEEPYQISSASQLESLADHPGLWDKHFILIDDVNMTGRTYQTALIAADANSAKGGFQGTPFTGSFDGNGFVISHLNIEPDVPSDFGFFRADLGLFGKIGPEGNIHRVRLENVQITSGIPGTQRYVGSIGAIGALAAENEGTISDCSVTGNIIARQHTFGAGALVGINRGEIHSSYSANGMVVGGSDVGGLVGTNVEGTIANCYSTISVEADRAVGGLVGNNDEGTLRFCYAAGQIIVEHDRNTGGLIGDEWPHHESMIINCFWDMETTGRLRSTGGMGLTTAEMMDAGVYALNGWAGNSNWIIDDGRDYPRLSWEGTVGTLVPEPVVDWLEGAGTAENPYRIATVEQFRQIATASVLFDKNFLLTTDINLEGIEWRPIGTCIGTEFNGVFDGNGHVTSSLNMTDPNGPQHLGMALFGYTANESVIKHLILKNITVVGGIDSENVSGLVGNNRGTVKDCHVEATLTGNNCGGLAGENAGLILYCSSTCLVSSDYGLKEVGCLVGKNSNGSVFACRAYGSIRCGDNSEYIGGAIGRNYWDATLIACSADVNVTCGDFSERVGGLVGFNWGTAITESYASGTLTVGEQSKCIGGLVGENWSNVVNCYATGRIVTGNETVDSGGLAGGLGSGGKVTGSYFLSPVDGGGLNNGIGTALQDAQMRQQDSFAEWDFIGIIADGITDYWQMANDDGYPVLTMFDGYEPLVSAGSGTLDDPYLIDSTEQLGFVARNPDACYRLVADLDLAGINWTTAVVPLLYGHFDGNGHSIRNLSVTGGSYMGLFGTVSTQATIADLGIIDANISGSDNSEYVAVLAAFNKGTITRCTVAGTVAGKEYIGGLTGENDGLITDCYATCSVAGGPRAGGLVGENNGPISTCYVNGEVSSANDEWGVGALVGYNNRGSLVNCLWEKHEGVIMSDLSQGLTTEQMMDGEILGLNGWAENPNWVIDNGNDYPRLVWEGTPGELIPIPTIDWITGNGTPEVPYLVETVEQLKLIGTANVLWDKHFVLTADLNCDGVQFERIGVCLGMGFSGNFDGANHRISNLTLGSNTPGQRNLGLFGYIDPEGCVSSLIMENVQITCGALSWYVATLAAVNQGTIINCGSAGSIDCGNACWAVGGLVGENDGILESCYADVTILVGDDSETMGGLIAYNDDGHVSYCYALGSIQAGSRVRKIGGLVGASDGPIVHCYATGHVVRKSAVINTYREMGGLVGIEYAGGVIASCYFLGRDNDIGTQLSSEEMRLQESFIGWDFSYIWMMPGGDYPKLQWEIEN